MCAGEATDQATSWSDTHAPAHLKTMLTKQHDCVLACTHALCCSCGWSSTADSEAYIGPVTAAAADSHRTAWHTLQQSTRPLWILCRYAISGSATSSKAWALHSPSQLLHARPLPSLASAQHHSSALSNSGRSKFLAQKAIHSAHLMQARARGRQTMFVHHPSHGPDPTDSHQQSCPHLNIG